MIRRTGGAERGHHNYGDVFLQVFMHVAHCLLHIAGLPRGGFWTHSFRLVLETLKRVGILHMMHCARFFRAGNGKKRQEKCVQCIYAFIAPMGK